MALTHRGSRIALGVINCIDCGFAHLDSLPDARTVMQYYEGDKFYNQHSPPGWFVKEKGEYDAHLWHPYFEYLASYLDSYLPTIDVGAGCGWFVDYLNWRGMFAYGIEPSHAARAFSPIKRAMFAGKGTAKKFGNVTCLLTLEHVLNPEQFLREDVLSLLHPKGRLIISVPNEFNPLQRLVRGDWFVSPVHINYFTGQTLDSLLRRMGLRIVERGATFPMELFLLIGRDHRGNDELGQRNHLARLRFEQWAGAKVFKWYGWLHRRFGIGRELVRVAEWA